MRPTQFVTNCRTNKICGSELPQLIYLFYKPVDSKKSHPIITNEVAGWIKSGKNLRLQRQFALEREVLKANPAPTQRPGNQASLDPAAREGDIRFGRKDTALYRYSADIQAGRLKKIVHHMLPIDPTTQRDTHRLHLVAGAVNVYDNHRAARRVDLQVIGAGQIAALNLKDVPVFVGAFKVNTAELHLRRTVSR